MNSNGLKVNKYEDWLRSKHGSQSKTRKGWINIHFAVEVNSHGVLAVEITDETVGDSSEAIPLISESQKKCWALIDMLGDGAYDNQEIFNYCAKHKIDPIIGVRTIL